MVCILIYIIELYVLVKALPQVLCVKYSTKCVAKMLIMHEAHPGALLASRPHAECFISRIAQARQCFNCFIEFSRLTLRYKRTCWLIKACLTVNGGNLSKFNYTRVLSHHLYVCVGVFNESCS